MDRGSWPRQAGQQPGMADTCQTTIAVAFGPASCSQVLMMGDGGGGRDKGGGRGGGGRGGGGRGGGGCKSGMPGSVASDNGKRQMAAGRHQAKQGHAPGALRSAAAQQEQQACCHHTHRGRGRARWLGRRRLQLKQRAKGDAPVSSCHCGLQCCLAALATQGKPGRLSLPSRYPAPHRRRRRLGRRRALLAWPLHRWRRLQGGPGRMGAVWGGSVKQCMQARSSAVIEPGGGGQEACTARSTAASSMHCNPGTQHPLHLRRRRLGRRRLGLLARQLGRQPWELRRIAKIFSEGVVGVEPPPPTNELLAVGQCGSQLRQHICPVQNGILHIPHVPIVVDVFRAAEVLRC